MSSRKELILVVALLLVQFWLRVQNPLALPAFVDENYHATRGSFVYELDRNPADFSHGKLLFYYWLGLFVPEGDGALAVTRLAVALWSLVTGAAVVAVARALFGRGAALPALLFYAVVPWAVFYERMALADPFAGGLAALVAWQSVRLARSKRPSARQGALTGLLVGLTLLAKLTTAFVVLLPFVAILLLDELRPAGSDWRALQTWLAALWARYRRARVAMFAAGGSVWALFLLAMLVRVLGGQAPRFFTRKLVVGGTPESTTLLENLGDLALAAAHLVSTPLTLGLLALAGVLWWRQRATAVFALAWLVVLWVPITLLGNPVKTRYLMVGVAATAVIFGGGVATLVNVQPVPALAGARVSVRLYAYSPFYGLEDDLAPVLTLRWLSRMGTGAFVLAVALAWVFSFALPFDRTSATNPAALDMPPLDRYTYLGGPDAGWGTREALAFLAERGQPIDGEVPVVAVILHCGSTNLHATHELNFTCADFRNTPGHWETLADARHWTPLHVALDRWPFVYLVTELNDAVPSGSPQAGVTLDWQPVFVAARPNGGGIVRVWRVSTR